jgi:hypothetical protein
MRTTGHLERGLACGLILYVVSILLALHYEMPVYLCI